MDKHEELAEKYGREAGENVASWIDVDEIPRDLDVHDVGVYLDVSAPFSGEWADGLTLEWLAEVTEYDRDDVEGLGDLATIFEDVYYQTIIDDVETRLIALRERDKDLLARLWLEKGVKPGRAVSVVGHRGIAFRFDRIEKERLVCIMVGDDREWTFDAEDIDPMDDLAYCAVCGQVGCTHDGRDREEG